jgi:hypothetical protein
MIVITLLFVVVSKRFFHLFFTFQNSICKRVWTAKTRANNIFGYNFDLWGDFSKKNCLTRPFEELLECTDLALYKAFCVTCIQSTVYLPLIFGTSLPIIYLFIYFRKQGFTVSILIFQNFNN